MKCPLCSAELEPGVTSCPACHAFQSVERTPVGVFAGWFGILSAVLTAMILTPVPFMVYAGVGLGGFPWILPGIGLVLTAAGLGYSRSTRRVVWLASNAPQQRKD